MLKISSKRNLLIVFVGALALRGIIFMNVAKHPNVIFQPDSAMYVSLADNIQEHFSLKSPENRSHHDVDRMPGYPILLATGLFYFGGNYLAVTGIQIILDSMSCILIYLLGEMIWKSAGFISGFFASVNIGMITYAHFILSDSMFLSVFLCLLIISLRFMDDPRWELGIVLGIGLGVAALIRTLVVYIPFFLGSFFFFYLWKKKNLKSLISAARPLGILLAFLLVLFPWLIRNHNLYGRFQMTAETGEQLLLYIVPFVWQYSKGIPFIDGMKKANKEFSEEAEKEGIDLEKIGPFEKSDLQVRTALNYLKKEPISAFVKAWFFGLVKNLFAPAIVDFSYLLNIKRPHFFYTPGATLIERSKNFIKGMPGFFGLVIIINIFLLMISRLIQLWGFALLFRKKRWEAIFFFLIIGYFLFVCGPVGYAKYRLPFEPLLIVLMAIGLKDLWERAKSWRGASRLEEGCA